MAEILQVDPRETTGSRSSNRLRAEGKIPGVLYGHSETPVSLTVSERSLRKALGLNAKVVELTGAASGQALVQDLQWDTFHRDLLHIDLLRIVAGEKVTVSVRVELKGEAPGAGEGGMIQQSIVQLEIETAPDNIPESLHLDVTQLQLGDSLSAGDVYDLPEDATLLTPADQMVVQCIQTMSEEEEEAPALDEGATPEVIGKGDKDEETESE